MKKKLTKKPAKRKSISRVPPISEARASRKSRVKSVGRRDCKDKLTPTGAEPVAPTISNRRVKAGLADAKTARKITSAAMPSEEPRENEAAITISNDASDSSSVAAAIGFFNNIMTASRMMTFLQCQRKHFWQYEIGLRKINEDALPLRFGSAWARAMEARWNGRSYEDALAAACPVGIDLDNYAMATISALLAAYYEVYGSSESEGKIKPEVQFKSDLGNGFTAEGKIDGLGELNNENQYPDTTDCSDGDERKANASHYSAHHDSYRSAIIESKTTSDSVAPDSDYWLRCTFNLQVNQYIVEARKLGHDVDVAFYDVTRKPGIKPKEIDDLDEQKRKIVEDANGVRQFTKDGSARQTGDKAKGWTVKSHVETPDEFCDRLYKDALARPDFYFARREMPVIEQNLQSFKYQRQMISETIGFLRKAECPPTRDVDAWPRNVSEHTCDFCPYKSFCLQGLSVDVANPPAGFSIQPFNPELQNT